VEPPPKAFKFSTEDEPAGKTFSFSSDAQSFAFNYPLPIDSNPIAGEAYSFASGEEVPVVAASATVESTTDVPSPPMVLGLVRDNTMLPITTDADDIGGLSPPVIQRNMTTTYPHGEEASGLGAPASVAKAPIVSDIGTESPLESLSSPEPASQQAQTPQKGPQGEKFHYSTPTLFRDPSTHSFKMDEEEESCPPLQPGLMERLNTSTDPHGSTSQPSGFVSPQSTFKSIHSHRGSLSRDEGFEILQSAPSSNSFTPSPVAEKTFAFTAPEARSQGSREQDFNGNYGFDSNNSNSEVCYKRPNLDINNSKHSANYNPPQFIRATTATNNHLPSTYSFDPNLDMISSVPKLGRAPTAIRDGPAQDAETTALTRSRTINANDLAFDNKDEPNASR